MADEAMEQDVQQAETEPAGDSSTAEQTTKADVSQDEGTALEQPTETDEVEGNRVPYERFKEVNDQVKELRGELDTLKSEREQSSTPKAQTPQEQAIRDQLKEMGFVSADEVEAKLEQREQDLALQREVSQLESKYDGKDGRPKFDKDEVLNFALEKQIGDLDAAYNELHRQKLIDWHVKQAVSKSGGVKSETSDGSGKSQGSDDPREGIKEGDRESLKAYIQRTVGGLSD